MSKVIKLTRSQLRSLVNEALSEDAFHYTGSERKLATSPDKKLKAVSADLNMVGTALDKAKEAVLDHDEEALAKWLQNVEKYAKSAYGSLLA